MNTTNSDYTLMNPSSRWQLDSILLWVLHCLSNQLDAGCFPFSQKLNINFALFVVLLCEWCDTEWWHPKMLRKRVSSYAYLDYIGLADISLLNHTSLNVAEETVLSRVYTVLLFPLSKLNDLWVSPGLQYCTWCPFLLNDSSNRSWADHFLDFMN